MIYTIHSTTTQNPLPIQLQMVGINHHQEPINRPHGISLYQWFYCAKGEGEFILDGQRSIISEGQAMLIYPDTSHSYRSVSADWVVHFVGFGGNICGELLRNLKMLESGVFHLSEPEVFLKYMMEITYLYQRKVPERESEYSALCYRFLLALSKTIRRVYPSELISENEVIRQTIFYMEENYMKDISLNELAEYVQMSKEYLCTVFKQNMGQTIMQYLRQLRISHARILLHRYPQKKTMEIAAMCGFGSPSYFGKIFREETGVTPEAYRRKY